MKKLKIFLVLLLTILVVSGCGLFEAKNNLYKDVIKIKIEVKDYGTMEAELYPNIAPVTVDNFVSLVKSGFYDGLTFHRIMPDYMIQGGDPTGTGSGGLDQKIKGEFMANGYDNALKHERGVLSMARLGSDYNSASCQFFIMQTTKTNFDGHYAAFGKVTKGIEIVDEIVKNTKIENEKGTVLKENQPVINKIYIVE